MLFSRTSIIFTSYYNDDASNGTSYHMKCDRTAIKKYIIVFYAFVHLDQIQLARVIDEWRAFVKHSNETSGFIKSGEFLYQLRDY
jgi:hypothetical protein